MFKQKSNLKKCIKILGEDLEDNKIHPSTVYNAIVSLENSYDMSKFFKSLKDFYKKMIKTELKKGINNTLTMGILEGKESVESIAEDCVYRKIAEAMPTNPNCERTDLYDLFPKLKKYVEYKKAEDFNESIGGLF